MNYIYACMHCGTQIEPIQGRTSIYWVHGDTFLKSCNLVAEPIPEVA